MTETNDVTLGRRLSIGFAMASFVLLVLLNSPPPKSHDGMTGATKRKTERLGKVKTVFDALWQRKSTRVFIGRIPERNVIDSLLNTLEKALPSEDISCVLRLGEQSFDITNSKLVPKGGFPKKSQAPACLFVIGPLRCTPETHFRAGQLLQAFALSLSSKRMGSCVVAGFDGTRLHEQLSLDPNNKVLYLLEFGYTNE